MKPGSLFSKLLGSGSSEAAHTIGCPGRRVKDYLTIDCSDCDGPQDLGQLRCLRGCVRTISKGCEIDRIALSRDVVVEYRGRSVAALQRMSAPLAASRTDRRIASRRCSKCPIEPSMVLDRLCADWPPLPPPESFRLPSHQGGGARCDACRDRTLAAIEVLRRDTSAVCLQLGRLSVKVLGGRR